MGGRASSALRRQGEDSNDTRFRPSDFEQQSDPVSLFSPSVLVPSFSTGVGRWSFVLVSLALCLWAGGTTPAFAPSTDRSPFGETVGSQIDSTLLRRNAERSRYLRVVTEALDTLIHHGTDQYGPVQSEDVLVSVLDAHTKRATDREVGDEPWRVDRPMRRNPGAADLLHDQALIRTMDEVSRITGEPRYRTFADRYIQDATSTLVADGDPSFWWGWHRRYDVFEDEKKGHAGSPHEIHSVETVNWERLYDVNPTATRAEVEHIWRKHVVDKRTGEINRHDDGQPGLSFIMSSGAFIEAFVSMHDETGEAKWLQRATLLADYNAGQRSSAGLLADAPNETSRWDGRRATTTLPGLYAGSLLRAYEISGEEMFRDQAVSYLKAWHRHAYDPEAESFWGALKLDGTPVEGPPVADGSYAQYEPRGHVDLWQPYVLGYQHPLAAAQSYARAYHITGDRELRRAAEHWETLIDAHFPPEEARAGTWYDGYAQHWAEHGTYAENYGRVVLFYLDLYEATGDSRHLEKARRTADEAIDSLWTDGLFRGHPNKSTYEAVDGVGLLMESLVRLARAIGSG